MFAANVALQRFTPLARQVTLWLLSLVPEEIVVEPDQVLKHALEVSQCALGMPSTPEQRLLLVALLAQRAVDDQEGEWAGDNIPVSAMREELPRLKAIEMAGDRWPLRR